MKKALAKDIADGKRRSALPKPRAAAKTNEKVIMEKESKQTGSVETGHDQDEQEPIYPTDLATLQDSGLAARTYKDHSTVEGAYFELSCYYSLLEEATAQLRTQFTDAERGYIVEVGNGCLFLRPEDRIYFPFTLEDALPGYAAKWEIDGQALMDKVKGLDRLSLFALADAILRWWVRQEREDSLNVSELFSPVASEEGKPLA